MVNERFIKVFLMSALAVALVWATKDAIRDFVFTQDTPRLASPKGTLAQYERAAIDIFRRTAPSVAYVYAVPYARGGGAVEPVTGSGFLWDSAGHIVTNAHLVSKASAVFVKLDREDPAEAHIIGTAPDYDLAVLRIVGHDGTLPPIKLGTSRDLAVGQQVFAIGNPFGLTRTLTTGIVSAVGRTMPTARGRELGGVIQIDAAINPGNSGGPLMDSSGRLIGVTTAIVSDTSHFSGVGFAVPVDLLNTVVPVLIRNGKVPKPGIGILAADEQVSVPLGVSGVVIARVLPGSTAAAAGLQGLDPQNHRIRDVITEANGKPVTTLGALADVFGEVGIGNLVTLTVERDGKARTVAVRIGDLS